MYKAGNKMDIPDI